MSDQNEAQYIDLSSCELVTVHVLVPNGLYITVRLYKEATLFDLKEVSYLKIHVC